MGSNYWENVRRRRITRRRALAAGTMGVAGATLAATVGCGDDDDDGGGSTTGPLDTSQLPEKFKNARVSEKFVVPINDPPQTLDFHTQETPGSHYAAHPAYNGFIYRPEDPPGNFTGLEPELIAEWEQPDATTTILKVRKGVKWQNVAPTNGRDFKAEDVKYTIERMRGEHPAGNQVTAEFRMKDMFDPIEKIEVTDDYTVRLKTKEPYAPLLNYLSFSWAQIIPREMVEAKGDRNVLTWATGTGPYILDGYDTIGDGGTIRYKKNPDYWKKGQPFFEKLDMRIATARETLQSMFLNDQVDSTANVDAAVTLSLRSNKPSVKIVEVPSFYVIKAYFDLTNQNSPWAKDKRLRQSLYYFFPYQTILKALGVECCRSGPMPPNQKPWALDDKELPAFGLSQEESFKKGLELMTAAGYPPGTEVPLEFTIAKFYGGDTIGELLVGLFQALKKATNGALNINAKLKVLELGDWFKSVYRGGGSYTASTHADWNYDDPDATFFRYFHSKGTANNTHIKNQKLDDMLAVQRREMDKEKRTTLVKDIQRLVLDEAPVIYMVAPNNFYALQPWLENNKLMVLNNIENPRHWDEIWANDKAPKRT